MLNFKSTAKDNVLRFSFVFTAVFHDRKTITFGIKIWSKIQKLLLLSVEPASLKAYSYVALHSRISDLGFRISDSRIRVGAPYMVQYGRMCVLICYLF